MSKVKKLVEAFEKFEGNFKEGEIISCSYLVNTRFIGTFEGIVAVDGLDIDNQQKLSYYGYNEVAIIKPLITFEGDAVDIAQLNADGTLYVPVKNKYIHHIDKQFIDKLKQEAIERAERFKSINI